MVQMAGFGISAARVGFLDDFLIPSVVSGLNAGYGSVGLFRASYLPSWREHPIGSPTEVTRFGRLHHTDRRLFKTASGGCAVRAMSAFIPY